MRPRLLDVTAVVAALGALAALLGVAVLAVPVHSPIQDCGTPFGFLKDGRVDRPADPADPPAGTTAAQVRAAAREGCHDRVVDRAQVAAVLLGGGMAVALGALTVEVVARIRAHRRRRRTLAPA